MEKPVVTETLETLETLDPPPPTPLKKKKSLCFGRSNFIAEILKKYFLIFSQKKSVLIFPKMESFSCNIKKNLVFP